MKRLRGARRHKELRAQQRTFKNGVPSRLFSGNSACGGTLSGGPCGVWKISMPFSQTWSYCFSPSTIVNIGAPVASFLDG